MDSGLGKEMERLKAKVRSEVLQILPILYMIYTPFTYSLDLPFFSQFIRIPVSTFYYRSSDISLNFISWPNGKRCRDGRGMGEWHGFSYANCKLSQASLLLDLLLFFS